MTKRLDIKDDEYNPYYAQYIDQVSKSLTLTDALQKGEQTTAKFFSSLSPEQQDYRYDEGKWTPKEVLLHIIDTERIFSYRALRFGRMDTSPLVGFDQDDYVMHSNASMRSMESLVAEYRSVRTATLFLFENLSTAALAVTGEASGSPLSPRAAGFITAGHEIHHIEIIKERYL